MAIDAGDKAPAFELPTAFPGHQKLRNLMASVPAAAGAVGRSGRIE